MAVLHAVGPFAFNILNFMSTARHSEHCLVAIPNVLAQSQQRDKDFLKALEICIQTVTKGCHDQGKVREILNPSPQSVKSQRIIFMKGWVVQ